MTDRLSSFNLKSRAEDVRAGISGSVYTIARQLGTTSALSLGSGTNSNLTLSGTSIVAASAIAAGVTQIAVVREASEGFAIEYPVALTGASPAGAGELLVCPFAYTNSLFPFTFSRVGGRVQTTFDRAVWAPTPDNPGYAGAINTFYVDISRPDDTGDGLTWATAKKTGTAAIDLGNAGANPFIIYAAAGTYSRANFFARTPTKPCAIIGVGGRVVTGYFDLTGGWSLDTGTTYKVTRADIRRCLDLRGVDQDGLFPDLTYATSLANCRATPGSWWTDNATVYVNRGDGAEVTDANTRLLISTGYNAMIRSSNGGNMFLKNFDCQGGQPLILTNSPTNRFVAEDCTFRYSSGDDGVVTATVAPQHGVTIFNLLGAAFIRCDASGNQSDGFNSHIASGVQAFVFTMDCTGFNNGRKGAASCNFITTHDGGKWIDLRGKARRNAGGQVAIVNDNTAMWCIDTDCAESRGDIVIGGTVPSSDYLVDQTEGGGTKVTLYLENCRSAGSLYPLNARYGTIISRGGSMVGSSLSALGGVIVSV
ncbi:hypothetical protein [Sphingomonas sp.]|uniref:hypothetical protein n=1 Tax=Sphingomonas sp. TaxID=28214 RepID=UPI000DAFDB09|nr:hypothetical protein [Sphingomonas sp.]PZU10916.1 MAG: hypothetical protein DI605_04680 [Sphingomonas sp.]